MPIQLHIEYIGDRQRSAVIKVIKSGDEDLRGLSFSPDGTRIVSIIWDNGVCMWDAASGKLITVLHRNTSKNYIDIHVSLQINTRINQIIHGKTWAYM